MTKRIQMIDGLRGFSLFGILLANLLIFQYGIYGKDEIELFSLSTVDQSFYAFTKIFIEGSFMPIFTFMFGYSLMMMRQQFINKELGVKWRLFRRFCVLMVLGILHGIYFWEGDILFLYGMMGIFLLIFVNRKAKTILVWLILFFLPLIALMLIPGEEEILVDSALEIAYINETMEIYQTGTYTDIKNYRNESEDPISKSMTDTEMLVIVFMAPLVIAPMFLFGMFAGKKQFFFNVENKKKIYWIGTLFGLILGLGMKIYGYVQINAGFSMIGGTILSVGYISLIALLYSWHPSLRLFTYFENVGKLSLTNYIMQTVICTTIFYGYGFGLFAKIGVFKAVLLGVLIFIMQMAASALYLRHFRYGPLEKIVRIGTYFSVFSLKKRKKNHRIDGPLPTAEKNI